MEGIRGTVKTLWPGGGTISAAAAALYSFPYPSSCTMDVEAAIEALRATLDLLSQTKMGQLFKLLDLLSCFQVLKGFSFFFLFFGKCHVLF